MEVTDSNPPVSQFGNEEYVFCSRECKDAFDKDPDAFLEQSVAPEIRAD